MTRDPPGGTTAIVDLRYGTEWALLELIARGIVTAEEQRWASELTSEAMDHERLFLQALRHQLGPLLAYYSDSLELSSLPELFQHELRRDLQSNRKHVEFLTDAALEIAEALAEVGVTTACTKGAVLAWTAYEDHGCRIMSDVDFVVSHEDVETVADTMKALGYSVGEFDWSTRSPESLDRTRAVEYRLFPDHMAPFIRAAPDAPTEPYVSVDFALSFTWHRSEWSAPVSDVLRKPANTSVIEVCGRQLPVLHPVWHFLRVVLHLFRESWLERPVRHGREVHLRKFADVARLWRTQRSDIQSANPVAVIRDHGLVQPVLWVLEHADRVLRTTMTEELGLGRVSEDWLKSARGGQFGERRWHGDMRRRLQEDEDVAFVASPSSAPDSA